MKKRVLSFCLSCILALSLPVTAMASEVEVSSDAANSVMEMQETQETQEEKDIQYTEETQEEQESNEREEEEISGASEEFVTDEDDVEENETEESSEWTVSDFTYTEMTQTLNGCDYTRQFKISGPAIAGFSESGEKKLETNKNLVLPSVNDEGEKLVGVADGAFKNKGLESVEFPAGMIVDYDDTITNKVTKRGNFIIGTEAFAKNNLTSVDLPDGVIAVMPSAFKNNQLTSVTLPHTIWWIENSSFAYNELETVGFPKTCDFQLQIHAFAFAQNNIKSVRLPDYTEVVHKYAFVYNPGMEDCSTEASEKEQSLGGVVYMYTDNEELADMERIHHVDRTAESQHSWHQKLIIGSMPSDESTWQLEDFIIEGTTITGLSESGIEKRKENKDLVLPDKNADGEYITELASVAGTVQYGLFATEDEKFDSVELPAKLEKIGNGAFRQNALKSVREFPSTLKEIGSIAFQTNELTSVVLPDSVTTLGSGAFATNPNLSTIVLSKGLTEIPASAFGCSDNKNYMDNLTELTIPEGVTKIGTRAFAGNNISNIVIPSTVKEIGNYAFSTKNYLNSSCTLTLPEGLMTIGTYAFRNKVIEEVYLPSTVTALKNNTFAKEYSDGSEAVVTKVYVSKTQYKDKVNFPDSEYHTYVLQSDSEDTEWDAYDFTYASYEELSESNKSLASEMTMYPASDKTKTVTLTPYFITGLSDLGKEKLEKNTDLVIPDTSPDGTKVTGIAPKAFYKMGLTSVTFPENVTTDYDGPDGIIADDVTTRGDFIICSSAFYGNQISVLKLPEGVIRVGSSAFNSNQLISVSIPKTMWWIDTMAFASNKISFVDFAQTCDFKLNMSNMAFGNNQIKSVRLPDRTENVHKNTFLLNTGMEEVDSSATTNEKKGGVVYMYADAAVAEETLVAHTGNTTSKSNVQKLITDEEMPESQTPWSASDFTYSEDGATITGLSESGAEKRAVNSIMIMPDKGPDGTVITAIGNGTAGGHGLFGAENEPITTVVLPTKLESIGNFAFQNCGIEKITFPETLKTIGMTAFQTNNLTEIILPDSITSVGNGAFATNPLIEKVKISKGMTAIPASFVTNNTSAENFTEIEIPEGITSIGNYAFSGNRFTTVEIPKTVTTIGTNAFKQSEGNSTIENIIFHEGLTSIGGGAFAYTKVTEIDIPSTLTTLSKTAFQNCPAANGGVTVQLNTSNKAQLTETKTFIVTGAGHQVVYNNLVGTGWSYSDFTFEGGTVTGLSDQGKETKENLKNLVIPYQNPETGEAITAIGTEAFAIPLAEVEILKDGFESPSGMTSVEIPDTVDTIGDQAFEYNALTEVTLPDGLTTIGESAFHGNQLKKLSLPDNTVNIGAGAFAANNITELKLPANIKKIEQGVFSMNIRLEQITLPDQLEEIGESAFAGARLTSLEIPASVTKIGKKAFHLHHLSELTIPGTVKEIGESAFEGTPKAITLTELTLSEGIETIGENAFKEGLLETVKIPSTLTSLASNAFADNTGVDNNHMVICYTTNEKHLEWTGAESYKIRLENTWTTDCFTYNGSIVTGFSTEGKKLVLSNPNVVIPDQTEDGTTVTEIASNAFANREIESVTLPAGLTTIGKEAFAGNKLTTVTIPDTVRTVAADAFANNETKVTLEISGKEAHDSIHKAGLSGVVIKSDWALADGDTSADTQKPETDEDTKTDTTEKVLAKKVKITGISKKIAAGKSIQLTAKITPSNATNKVVTWKSSNTKYARVNASGKVTVKKAGIGKTVVITAIAKDGSGKKASYKITIMKDAVKSIQLKAVNKVKAGKSVKVKATVRTTGKKANKALKWTSSNKKYATVNSKGVVKTKKAGKGKTVTITASAKDGSGKVKKIKIKIQ